MKHKMCVSKMNIFTDATTSGSDIEHENEPKFDSEGNEIHNITSKNRAI